EGNIAYTQLQWQYEVHESDHEWHGDEENHDRAVSGEDLIVMLGWKITLCMTGGQRQLAAHQHGIRESAHEHEKRQRNVHDPDALVIDARNPFAPQIWPPAFDRYQPQYAKNDESDGAGRDHDHRLVERNCRPGEPAEHTKVLAAAKPPTNDPTRPCRKDHRSPARRSV